MLLYVFTLLALVIALPCNGADHVIYERCMRGKFHKIDPSPEPSLHECGHYTDRSCCTNDTAASLRDEDVLYKFNYNHCSTMSTKCKDFFLANNCFYECSPNVWPWLTSVNNTYRKERYHDVPLCQSNCNQWWDACKAEMTCVVTWSTGFTWKNKVNECPTDKPCKSFGDIYQNSTFFCENVWGPHDYAVVPDSNPSQPCLTFTFNQENPNTKAADFYAKEKGLICDKTDVLLEVEKNADLEVEIKRLKTEVAILGTFFGLICFVIATSCFAYFRCGFPAESESVPATTLSQRMINLSQVYRSGNDGSIQSSDSKVSFVNNLYDDDREALTPATS